VAERDRVPAEAGRGVVDVAEGDRKARALDVAIIDPTWAGGLTEARRIASLTALHGVPVAPHDCTGPVSLATGLHLVTSIPNGFV
jgi:L-alanine-DL-glutamate epimerase-like enolase superfamily enzyme